MATTGVDAPGRAQVGVKTLRTDAWWIQPALVVLGLTAFVAYGVWRVFWGSHTYYSAPYQSIFYSPCIADSCVPGTNEFAFIGSWWAWTPALLVAWIPLGFRLTCYYYRKAYFRSYWLSPPACAVPEPRKSYTGERRFPLILNNSHRWFFYLGMLLALILTYDAVLAFRNPQGQWGHMGLGTVLLVVNAFCLWAYTLSCHSCRNTIAGRLNHFSKHPLRYRMWTIVSRWNRHHPKWAWISLATIVIADYYVYLLASGHLTDPRFF
ncbi:MAG: hypothetical protein ABI468_04360 [Candidatus Nanopelagicales bacterium]